MTSKVRILGLVAVSLGLLSVPSAHGATETIRATASNRWDPDFQHITKGDRIRWKNPASNSFDHVVKSYGGNWNKNVRLDPGETTRKRFRRAGVFKYRCTLHSTLASGDCTGMCGVIHVTN